MKKDNDWKDRLGIVYSTNQDYSFHYENSEQSITLPPEKQVLRLQLSTRHRNGKTVTLVTGFIGSDDDLKKLEKELKSKCATGGSSKDGEIIIQGDLRNKIREYLESKKYKVKG